ncbi:MAG TPA: histidine kinase [Bacteroidia bacterium]|nr:histidine kinase [Bacteroidia bacterium]
MSFAQITNGLVARYSFNNGNSNDDIGPYHAKAVGVSLVDDRFGNKRSAYYLHGTYGSYLNLGTNALLKPVNGSISLWFKIDTPIEAGSGYKINPLIITKCQPGDDFFEAYCIYYNYVTGKLSAGTTLSSLNQVGLHTSSTVSLHEWHHVLMSYDHDFLTLYLDGNLESKISKNFTTWFLENDSVMVGNSANTKNKRFFNGSIDDIEIYNRVLLPDEVKALYGAPDPNWYGGLKRWLIISLFFIIATVLVILYVINRYNRAFQKEKTKNEIQNQMYEMEIRVMKAQMNPHFVFNSLNVVQEFILANDNEKAYKYLVKFSKLVRKLLESNTANSISLAEEIDILERYVEIETLRFEQTFQYEMRIGKDIMPGRIYIPHMLIQPFIENALWHGLLRKKSNRRLWVSFSEIDKDRILCSVEDNGMGYMKETENRTLETKPMAIEMIRQRLKLIEKIKGIKGEITITDRKNEKGENEGTKIEIIIPILDKE